jgi:hypothetical protein
VKLFDEIEMYDPSRKWYKQGMLLLKEFSTLRREGFNSNDFIRWADYFDDFAEPPCPTAFQTLLRIAMRNRIIKVKQYQSRATEDEGSRTVWVMA